MKFFNERLKIFLNNKCIASNFTEYHIIIPLIDGYIYTTLIYFASMKCFYFQINEKFVVKKTKIYFKKYFVNS